MGQSREAELAYIAGIFDGEGTITLHITPNKARVYPNVAISNTDSCIVEFCQAIIGGSIRLSPRPKNQKTTLILTPKRSHLPMILESLVPYLVAKKKVAELLLRYIRLRDENKWRHGYTKAELELIREVRQRSGSNHFKDFTERLSQLAIIPSKEELTDLYINKNLTRKQLASNFNRNISSMRKTLKRYNIRKYGIAKEV